MADPGAIYAALGANLGNQIGDAMQQYHKEHQTYDQQLGLADALSRIGVSPTGQLTSAIGPDGKPIKDIQPLLDSKAVDLYRTNAHGQQMKNLGAMEALNRIGVNALGQTAGQLGQAHLQAARQANQRYDVTVGDQTYPATAGQAIQSGFEQQRLDIAKQPKGPSATLEYRKQQDALKQQQKQQEALPEFQFQKKYQVMPKDILNQPMGYETQFQNPNETDPAKKIVQGYTPTTPVYRERKFTTNQQGVKQDQYAPDPNGDIVNFKGQRIPFQEYQTLLNRQNFLFDRARASLQRGAPPADVAARLESMGFDPAGVQ